jgi:hypothetical protein
MMTYVHSPYLAELVFELEMFQIKVVKKIGKHISCSIQFFFSPTSRAVYEVVCKNMVQLDRPRMTIWRMRFA